VRASLVKTQSSRAQTWWEVGQFSFWFESEDSYGSSFLFPRRVDSAIRGVRKRRRTQRGNVLRLIQIRLTTSSLGKILLGCQDKTLQARIADSSAIKAISFRRLRREIKGDQNSR